MNVKELKLNDIEITKAKMDPIQIIRTDFLVNVRPSIARELGKT